MVIGAGDVSAGVGACLYEAARRIRAQEAGREVLLIALTGWGQEDDRRRSLEAGFDHHLVKPVDVNALRQLLAAPRRKMLDIEVGSDNN